MRKVVLAMAALGAFGAVTNAGAATTKPLLDCPTRDAPFSVDGPLIDIMLSDAAKKVVEKHVPGVWTKVPPFFAGTKTPTFSAIMTFKKLAGLVGAGAPAIDFAKLDADLRALPVTTADKAARCERYDDDRPVITKTTGKLRVLLFEKITGFRDAPSVMAANAAFKAMAERNGWALTISDKGGSMHPSILKNVDTVIWNNVSGDVLTLTQRKAFQRYIESGGGFVGIHGSAGDPIYFWDWYPDTLIGARFIGHPSDPQFQDARVNIETSPSGIGTGLNGGWTMNDEWYSFEKSARLNGATVVATLDEKTYTPGKTRFGGPPLEMGADHPIAWTRRVGKGRSFYSAIGHLPEVYSNANHVKMLEQAIVWAGTKPGKKYT